MNKRKLAALAALLVVAGCGTPLLPCCEPDPAQPGEVWLISLGHSESDQAEEQSHLADLERVLLPQAARRGATVLAYTVGADGYTSPRVLATIGLDTSDVDGGNPVLRDRLQAERTAQLIAEVKTNLAQIPFSPASDPFGGFAAAQAFFSQFPRETAKTLIAVGDQLANRPTGCVLGARDMSTLERRAALLQVCAPSVPDLRSVRIMLVGAGFSLDDPIDTDVAVGLELLLREFLGAAGAAVVLYGPVAVAPGPAAAGLPR